MKTKKQIKEQWKAALEHKKEWQKNFVEKYASEGMHVEFL